MPRPWWFQIALGELEGRGAIQSQSRIPFPGLDRPKGRRIPRGWIRGRCGRRDSALWSSILWIREIRQFLYGYHSNGAH
jgi:hypothetical protein